MFLRWYLLFKDTSFIRIKSLFLSVWNWNALQVKSLDTSVKGKTEYATLDTFLRRVYMV